MEVKTTVISEYFFFSIFLFYPIPVDDDVCCCCVYRGRESIIHASNTCKTVLDGTDTFLREGRLFTYVAFAYSENEFLSALLFYFPFKFEKKKNTEKMIDSSSVGGKSHGFSRNVSSRGEITYIRDRGPLFTIDVRICKNPKGRLRLGFFFDLFLAKGYIIL